jgi:tetratricopeptide (TPR) repeat protein
MVDDALRLLRHTIEVARATRQPEHAINAHIIIARTLRSTGDLDGALAAIREGESLLESPPLAGLTGWEGAFGVALVTQGEILGEDNAVSLGRSQEAAKYFERGYRLAADRAQRDPDDALSRFAVSIGGIRLAGILRHSDPRRALAIYDEVLRRLAEVKNNSRARRDEVRALARSTYPLRQIGRSIEARARLDAAFSRLRELKLYPAEQVTPGSEADNALTALAEYEAGRGRVLQGIETYQQLLDRVMASKPKPESNLWDAFDLSNIYAALAVLYRRARQTEAAIAVEARRQELWRHWDRKLPNNSFVLRQIAGKSIPMSAPPRN